MSSTNVVREAQSVETYQASAKQKAELGQPGDDQVLATA